MIPAGMLPMDTARMAPLDPARVRYLVIHTAATAGNRDCTAAEVNDWHRRENGWAGIGYHYLIRQDGTVEEGRPLRYQGAHVFGINHMSVGVCCAGNGDLAPFTAAQLGVLARLGAELMVRFQIPPERVIGHRDVNQLVDQGVVPSSVGGKSTRTPKSCPGVRVVMSRIRDQMWALLPPAYTARLAS